VSFSLIKSTHLLLSKLFSLVDVTQSYTVSLDLGWNLSDAMITRLLGAIAPRRHDDLNANLELDNSTVGRPVARFGQRKFCWEAIGSPRTKFVQEIRPQISKLLDGHFGTVPGNDYFTLSLYVVGTSKYTAIPTILFVSRCEKWRKKARKAISESGIFSHYPEFDTQYVNKDPGSINMMTLAAGKSSNSRISMTEDTKKILYDASLPITSMGLPIYIRNVSSLRPATANIVRVGDQIFFQTVQHAFRDVAVGVETASVTLEEDLVIDSDSETDDDHYNEAQVEVTSAGSRSPDVIPCFGSQYSEHSRSSSSTPHTSAVVSPARDHVAAKMLLNDAAGQFNIATSRMHEAVANVADFATTNRTFPLVEPALPSPETLSLLGKLVDESTEYDLALIEITDQKFKAKLESLLKNGRVTTLAYDSIVSNPQNDAEVYTYTASGGKLCGVLSATSSYTRLSTGTSFQKIYIVRFEGSLANGDCGSAVIDAKTGGTYGHLVAGCRTTGTAYILAADQAAEDATEALLKEATQEQHSMKGSCDSPGPSLSPKLQSFDTPQSKAEDTLVDLEPSITANLQIRPLVHDRGLLRNVRHSYTRKSGSEREPPASKARKPRRCARNDRQAKKWRSVFSTRRRFEDTLFFEDRESIAGFERAGGPLDAFLEDADSSIPSWEMTVIREFLQARKPQPEPVRESTRARLDDREHKTGIQRGNSEWLTASALRDFLSLPVLLPRTYT
jgi:hypothetical protein